MTEETTLDAAAAEILGELKHHKDKGRLSAFSVSKEISKRFFRTATIDSIAAVIKEIGDTAPLVRREDGSPDALSTIKAIKAADKQLYNKLVIFSLLARSNWSNRLTDCASLASFTPILLVAYKSECSFREWDTKANWGSPVSMYVALGTVLANLMVARPKSKDIFSPDFIKELATNGIKYKTFKAEDAIIKQGLGSANGLGNRRIDNKAASIAQLKIYAYMLSSTWLAHPSIRDTDTMILDIYDWSFIPESVEDEEVLDVEEPVYDYDDL